MIIKRSEWEKIVANHIRDLYLEYVKNTYNSIIKKKNLKWAKDLDGHVSGEDIQKTNTPLKISQHH